jgi:hypothetical protein
MLVRKGVISNPDERNIHTSDRSRHARRKKSIIEVAKSKMSLHGRTGKFVMGSIEVASIPTPVPETRHRKIGSSPPATVELDRLSFLLQAPPTVCSFTVASQPKHKG